MTTIRLTARGRKVRNAIVTAAIILLAWRLNDLTTPEACKVSIEAMSQACKGLLYP